MNEIALIRRNLNAITYNSHSYKKIFNLVKMEHQETTIGIFNIVIVLISTNVLFKYFSFSNTTFWRLLFRVLPFVWFIVVVLTGVEDFYFKRTSTLFDFIGFIGIMARTFPILIIFSLLPLIYKYHKLKKSK